VGLFATGGASRSRYSDYYIHLTFEVRLKLVAQHGEAHRNCLALKRVGLSFGSSGVFVFEHRGQFLFEFVACPKYLLDERCLPPGANRPNLYQFRHGNAALRDHNSRAIFYLCEQGTQFRFQGFHADPHLKNSSENTRRKT
jgi:hypothetical protein